MPNSSTGLVLALASPMSCSSWATSTLSMRAWPAPAARAIEIGPLRMGGLLRAACGRQCRHLGCGPAQLLLGGVHALLRCLRGRVLLAGVPHDRGFRWVRRVKLHAAPGVKGVFVVPDAVVVGLTRIGRDAFGTPQINRQLAHTHQGHQLYHICIRHHAAPSFWVAGSLSIFDSFAIPLLVTSTCALLFCSPLSGS